ncbi:hypothetical protein B0I28_101254 [Glycomyces artemisiae]|uniref:Uncharacterized protein n=1 Tax=Glycomyces artemisiae TaxID=1076443 RepID=A0A2T0UVJ4_9ACTN|nr:hypothetical protein B0I28_101254 [Glycomyces artemisiae]
MPVVRGIGWACAAGLRRRSGRGSGDQRRRSAGSVRRALPGRGGVGSRWRWPARGGAAPTAGAGAAAGVAWSWCAWCVTSFAGAASRPPGIRPLSAGARPRCRCRCRAGPRRCGFRGLPCPSCPPVLLSFPPAPVSVPVSGSDQFWGPGPRPPVPGPAMLSPGGCSLPWAYSMPGGVGAPVTGVCSRPPRGDASRWACWLPVGRVRPSGQASPVSGECVPVGRLAPVSGWCGGGPWPQWCEFVRVGVVSRCRVLECPAGCDAAPTRMSRLVRRVVRPVGRLVFRSCAS